MATVTLQAAPRAGTGKGVARKLRQQHRVPAVLYGRGAEPIHLSIDATELRHALTTPSGVRVVLRVQTDGSDGETVAIVREVQRHPVSRDYQHIDLLSIDLDKPIEVSVPIKPVGTPIGVRLEDGALQWSRRELEIRVLPTKIPEEIELDVSELHVNQALHIGDIPATGFDLIGDPEQTVCSVASTRLEVEETEAEGEEVAGEGAEGAEESTPAEDA